MSDETPITIPQPIVKPTKHQEKPSSPPERHGQPKIHPIIIYPFGKPNYTSLGALYDKLIKKLSEKTDIYSRPITIINQQTHHNNTFWGHLDQQKYKEQVQFFTNFQHDYVEAYSVVEQSWSVDTCQMWLDGFGKAYQEGNKGDVYWLIPGDFDYDKDAGKEVFQKIEEIPRLVRDGSYDLMLGEITVSLNSSKQLIDTYGTYGLLYNWFPAEAQGIRTITDKPRTEFFAISHSFLDAVLRRRWYPYEQTIVILLHGMRGKEQARRIHKIDLGEISDSSDHRDSLASAMQQVERTERVLKLYWREYHEQTQDPNWRETFRKLDSQSQQIRGAALVILEQILR